MANVDERVVSMKFDNKEFEKNAKTTMTTLDKLKQSLTFSNIGDGIKSSFNKIHNTVNSFANTVNKVFYDTQKASSTMLDVTGIQKSLDAIQSQTSVFGEFVKTKFTQIVDHVIGEWNKAYNAVIKQPLTDGFKEYELKMDSVQTIMASTGASLEEVNGYLAELNTYADRTIYSFSDMTSSIGKFTNSGVKLEDAVKAIQGISNEAAISGANAQQASHAMYNFAQALSSGSVKLIDWKSIENANMATVEFKQNLIDTALELGTVVKEGDEYRSVLSNANGQMGKGFTATKGFNDELQYQWMTTDVLVKTLGKYTDETTELGKKAFAAAQDVKTWSQLLDTLKEALGSGWGQSFEMIIGDFNEAKTLFTDINNVLSRIVDKTSDFRNAFIKAWVDNGGRDKLITDINKILIGFEKVTDTVMGFTETGLKLVLGENYKKVFGDFTTGLGNASKAAEDAQKKLMHWQAAYDIWVHGTYGNGQERKDAIEAIFKDEGASYEAIQNIIEGIIDGSVDIYTGLENVKAEAHDAAEEQKKLADNTDSVANSFGGAEPVINKVYDTFNSLRNSVNNVKIAITNLFEAARNIVGIFGKSFLAFADYRGVASDVEYLTACLKTLSEILKGSSEKASSLRVIFAKIFTNVNKVYSFFRETMAAVKENLSMVFTTLTQNQTVVTKVRSTMSSASQIIMGIARGISNLAIAFINVTGVFVDSFLRVFKFDEVAHDLSGLVDKFVEWTKNIREGSTDTESLSEKFDNFFEHLNDAYDKLKDIFAKVIEIAISIKDKIRDVINTISEWSSNIDEHSKLYRAWNAISTITTNLIGLFDRIKKAIKDAFGPKILGKANEATGVFKKIYDVVKKIVDGGLEAIVEGLEKIAKFDFSAIDLSWIDKVANFNMSGLFDDADKLDGVKAFLDGMGLDKSKFNIDNPFANLADWIMGAFTEENLARVKAWGKMLGDSILRGLADLDWSAIWSFTSFIIFLVSGIEIINMLKSITKMMSTASGLMLEVQTQIKNIGNAIKAKIMTDALNVSLTLIVSLVLALIIFTELPQDKLVVAATVMVIVLESVYRIINKLTEVGTAASTSNSKLKKLTALVNAFSGVFGAIGLIMVGIAALAAVMAIVDHPVAILTGVIIVVAIVAAMAVGIVILLEKFGGVGANLEKLTKAMMDAFKAIAMMVITLAGVALAIEKFNISWDDMAIALGSLIIVLLLFAGLCYVTKYFPATGAGTIQRVAKSMILIAASIDTMIPAIATLAIIGGLAGAEVMEKSVLSIMGIMIAMGVLMFVMTKTAATMPATTVKKVLMLTVAMGLILAAVAMVLQTGALATLASMSATPEGADKLMFILEIVAAGILAVALAVTLMSFAMSRIPGISRSFLQLALGLAGIGAAVLGVGAGILAIVYALASLPKAADGLVIFAQKIEENGPVIAKTFATLVLVVIGAILGVLAATKASVALQIVALVIYIAIILATFVHGHIGDIVAWIGQILLDIVALLGGIVGDVVYALLELLIVIVGWLAIGIIDKGPTLLNILTKALDGIIAMLIGWLESEIEKGLGDVLMFMGEVLEEFGESTGMTSVQGFGLMLDNYGISMHQKGSSGKNLGYELADNAKAEINEILGEEQTWMENASEEFKKKSKNFTKILGDGNMDMQSALNFGTNFDGVEAATKVSDMFADPTKALYTNSINMKGAAGDAAKNVISGYDTLEEAIKKGTLSYEEWQKKYFETHKNAAQKSSFELHNLYEQYKKDQAKEIAEAYDAQKNSALEDQLEQAAGSTKKEFIMDMLSGNADLSVSDFLNVDASTLNTGSLDDWEALGLDSGQMFADGFINGAGEFNGDASYSMADLYNMYGTGEDGKTLEELGFDTSEELADGSEENTEAFKEAARTLGDALMDEFHDVTEVRAYEEGKNICDSVRKGLIESLEHYEHVVKNKAKDTGEALADGIKVGYTAKMREIRDTAYATGNTILKAFCRAMDIASPSKQMARLGRFTVEGLIVGMKQENDAVVKETTDTADTIINSVTNTMRGVGDLIRGAFGEDPILKPTIDISGLDYQTEQSETSILDALKSPMDFLISYFNGELEYDPSIRPTMDISDVRYGTGLLNNMLASKSYEVGAEVNASMNQIALDKMDYMEAMRTGYNDGNVIGAIGKLNNDINSLNESMSNMTVVMDTGALVGSIAEPVDYALGQRQYMRGRGM